MSFFPDRVYFIFKADAYDAQNQNDKGQQKLKMVQTFTEPFRETVPGENPRKYAAKCHVDDWADLEALFPPGLVVQSGDYEDVYAELQGPEWVEIEEQP